MTGEKLTMALTPEQFAEETSLHINTIYKLLKDGKLPHIKLARRYLISRIQAEAWLSGNQPGTGSSPSLPVETIKYK
jgi:excisionase family DNA binding protein